ncbi:MAG: ankyrin repeat domain-containing protein [Myxococcota bacterium]
MTQWTERWDEESIIDVLGTGDLDRRDESGATAVWHAAYFGQTERVAELLDAGADPNAHDAQRIAKSSRGSHIVEIWDGIPEDANLAPRGKSTLLHVAAARVGEVTLADLLIDRGFDVNARDGFGSTPLHIAVFASNEAFARRLLERGADPNLHDATGHAPLDHAIAKPELMRMLLDAGGSPDGGPKAPWAGKSYEWTAVTNAAYTGADSLKLLLDAGADVSKHPLALPLAAKQGMERSVRLLLKAGADVDATIEWCLQDRPALEAAAMYASVACVKLLVPRCKHQLDRALEAAVAFACEDSDQPPNDRGPQRQKVVAMLLEQGADPAAALVAASKLDTAYYLQMLLEAGAKPCQADAYGRTPLHYAAGAGRRDLVRMLLSAGADPGAEDNERETPWERAKRAYYEHSIHDARLVMHDLREAGGAPPTPAAPEAEPEPEGIVVGCRVAHAKFGSGEVKAVSGPGDQAKVTVAFEGAGDKVLLSKFVKKV